MLSRQALRDKFAEQIALLNTPNAIEYAQFIREGDIDYPAPCWGDILAQHKLYFPTDEERLKLLDVLLAINDEPVLLMFLHCNRMESGVWQAILNQLDRFPPELQRAVIAIGQISDIPTAVLEKLHSVAQLLIEASDEIRKKELDINQEIVDKMLSP